MLMRIEITVTICMYATLNSGHSHSSPFITFDLREINRDISKASVDSIIIDDHRHSVEHTLPCPTACVVCVCVCVVCEHVCV